MSDEAVAFCDVNQTLYPDTCQPLKLAAANREITLSALGRGAYPGDQFKPDDLNGVRSIGYWDAKKEQGFGLPLHRNEGIEFCLCEAGELVFSCGDKQHYLQANMFTVTRPWQPHQLGDPNIRVSRLHWLILDVGVRSPHQEWQWPDWIILDREILSTLTRLLRENEEPVWMGDEAVVQSFRQLSMQLSNYGSSEVSSQMKLLINGLLLNIYAVIKAHRPALDATLTSSERTVRLFLNQLPEMSDIDWTSEAMAQYCHLRSTRFIFYCKKLTNMSPIQYLNFVRIKQAKQALVMGDKSITEIALDCGFSSSQYFNRVFKKGTGKTPQEYRRRVKVKENTVV